MQQDGGGAEAGELESSHGSNEAEAFEVEWSNEDSITRSEMRFIVKHNQLMRNEHSAGVLKRISMKQYRARVKRGSFVPNPIRFKPVVTWVRVKYNTVPDRARLLAH
jgi:hypothetical protein